MSVICALRPTQPLRPGLPWTESYYLELTKVHLILFVAFILIKVYILLYSASQEASHLLLSVKSVHLICIVASHSHKMHI